MLIDAGKKVLQGQFQADSYRVLTRNYIVHDDPKLQASAQAAGSSDDRRHSAAYRTHHAARVQLEQVGAGPDLGSRAERVRLIADGQRFGPAVGSLRGAMLVLVVPLGCGSRSATGASGASAVAGAAWSECRRRRCR